MKQFPIYLFILFSFSLSAQTDSLKNKIEINLIQLSNYSISSLYLAEEPGIGFNYERAIYSDNINTFSIGLSGMSGKVSLWKSYLSADFFTSYDLFADFEVLAIGPKISNKFGQRFDKLGLFMELELSSFFQWEHSSNSTLYENGSFGFGSDINYKGTELEIENDVKINPVIFNFGLQLGVEFFIHDALSIYLSPGWSKSINGYYKEEKVSDLIPYMKKELMNIYSLSLGTRF